LHVYKNGFSIIDNKTNSENKNEKAFVYCNEHHLKLIKAKDVIKVLNARLNNGSLYLNPLSLIEIIEKADFKNLDEIAGIKGYVNVKGLLNINNENKRAFITDENKTFEIKNLTFNSNLYQLNNKEVFISDILFNSNTFYAKDFTRFFIRNH
jgi:hypothetical protein